MRLYVCLCISIFIYEWIDRWMSIHVLHVKYMYYICIYTYLPTYLPTYLSLSIHLYIYIYISVKQTLLARLLTSWYWGTLMTIEGNLRKWQTPGSLFFLSIELRSIPMFMGPRRKIAIKLATRPVGHYVTWYDSTSAESCRRSHDKPEAESCKARGLWSSEIARLLPLLLRMV